MEPDKTATVELSADVLPLKEIGNPRMKLIRATRVK